VLVAGIVLVMGLVVLNAWVCDDAYITFRTVDNFLRGHGLRWNVLERVQSYTHPLWLFCLAGLSLLTREQYHASLALSFGLALWTALLLVFRASLPLGGWRRALLCLTTLACSRCFVEYSTSGLENPLSHLLLALFLPRAYALCETPRQDAGAAGRELLWLALLACLGVLNRADTVLLFAPPLVLALWRQGGLGMNPRAPRLLPWVGLGFVPLLAWEFFSLLYYGVPAPNTAYAKLNVGLPALDLLRQGGWYFLNVARFDPVTAAALLAGLGISLQRARENAANLGVGLGLLLYAVYILKIGGDFMSTRFFSAPLVCALFVLGRVEIRSWKGLSLGLAAILLLGVLTPRPTWLWEPIPTRRGIADKHGIADERRYYAAFTGLLQRWLLDPPPFNRWETAARGLALPNGEMRLGIVRSAGMHGYFAGPTVHLIDVYALCDPLLARLPMRKGKWRIGHYLREIPEGYPQASFERGRIESEPLQAYWEKLRLITRADLFAPGRLQAIWELNLGRHEQLLVEYIAETGGTR
jgi:arabinofuranosyltransferase